MNTIEDLEVLVQDALRESLDGESIDVSENDIRLPHMLGIVDIGESADTDKIDGSLLDSDHEFWEEYSATIVGRLDVAEEVDRATRRLSNKGVLTIERDGDIAHVTIDE